MAMAMLGAVASTQVVALGLGEIELNSALNQPFNAEVSCSRQLTQSWTNSRSALDPRGFRKAGIERPIFLNKLKFDVMRKDDGKRGGARYQS